MDSLSELEKLLEEKTLANCSDIDFYLKCIMYSEKKHANNIRGDINNYVIKYLDDNLKKLLIENDYSKMDLSYLRETYTKLLINKIDYHKNQIKSLFVNLIDDMRDINSLRERFFDVFECGTKPNDKNSNCWSVYMERCQSWSDNSRSELSYRKMHFTYLKQMVDHIRGIIDSVMTDTSMHWKKVEITHIIKPTYKDDKCIAFLFRIVFQNDNTGQYFIDTVINDTDLKRFKLNSVPRDHFEIGVV